MKNPLLLLVILTFFFFNNINSQENYKSEKEIVDADIQPEAIQERIRTHRMGDIVVKSKPNTEVHIQQTRHEFLFGTAIPNHLAENSAFPMSDQERENFLRILEDNFNYAVHENALKWYDNEKQQGIVDYSVADRIWELCNERDIPMRGHCIFWAKDEFLMDWLKEMDNESLRKAVQNRAQSVAEHYKGRINEFDLNNEMIHGDFFRRRLGYGIMNEMAWMVKAVNPDAKLYMNDYGILDVGHNAGPYIQQTKRLIESGVPIDGLGCQAHKSTNYPVENTPYQIQKTLNRLATLNLSIKITEALFNYEEEQTKVDQLNKLLPIYFAHPSVEAIVFWGIWEKVHWVPNAAMWRTDFTPTPQAEAYRKLVYKTWWIDETLVSDKNGEVKIPAFYGDYTITVGKKSKDIKHAKANKSTRVEL